MSFSKTISTLLITALVGALSFIFAIPKKQNNTITQSTVKRPEVEDRENLFI